MRINWNARHWDVPAAGVLAGTPHVPLGYVPQSSLVSALAERGAMWHLRLRQVNWQASLFCSHYRKHLLFLILWGYSRLIFPYFRHFVLQERARHCLLPQNPQPTTIPPYSYWPWILIYGKTTHLGEFNQMVWGVKGMEEWAWTWRCEHVRRWHKVLMVLSPDQEGVEGFTGFSSDPLVVLISSLIVV